MPQDMERGCSGVGPVPVIAILKHALCCTSTTNLPHTFETVLIRITM